MTPRRPLKQAYFRHRLLGSIVIGVDASGFLDEWSANRK